MLRQRNEKMRTKTTEVLMRKNMRNLDEIQINNNNNNNDDNNNNNNNNNVLKTIS